MTVSEAELSRLIGHTPGCIRYWTEFGILSRNKSGRYHLRTALQQIEQYYKSLTTVKISLASVSQLQLAQIMGVTRQTIHDWTISGMPRNEDGTYDVVICLRWLPRFYEKLYREKYHNKIRGLEK